MVRLILFFLVLLVTPFLVKGQGSIIVEPMTFVLSGNPSQPDIHYDIHVINTTSETVDIFWSKRMTNNPLNWESYICDQVNCYIPSVNSCPSDKPNMLGPGDTMAIQVHLYPYLTEGTANYQLNVIDAEGNNIAIVEGVFQVSATTAVKEISGAKLSVFPNPTTESFQVSESSGLRYVEVFNIIGNKVKSFDAAPYKQYFVGDLTDGIYLVRLLSPSKKVLKTIRLSKR